MAGAFLSDFVLCIQCISCDRIPFLQGVALDAVWLLWSRRLASKKRSRVAAPRNSYSSKLFSGCYPVNLDSVVEIFKRTKSCDVAAVGKVEN